LPGGDSGRPLFSLSLPQPFSLRKVWFRRFPFFFRFTCRRRSAQSSFLFPLNCLPAAPLFPEIASPGIGLIILSPFSFFHFFPLFWPINRKQWLPLPINCFSATKASSLYYPGFPFLLQKNRHCVLLPPPSRRCFFPFRSIRLPPPLHPAEYPLCSPESFFPLTPARHGFFPFFCFLCRPKFAPSFSPF